jgi:hypothetical protein
LHVNKIPENFTFLLTLYTNSCMNCFFINIKLILIITINYNV